MSPAAPALRRLRREATCLAIAFMAASSCSDAGNGARTSEPPAPDRWSIDKAGGNGDQQRDTVLSMIAQLAVLVHENDRPAGACDRDLESVAGHRRRDDLAHDDGSRGDGDLPVRSRPDGRELHRGGSARLRGLESGHASPSASSQRRETRRRWRSSPGPDQTDTATAQLQADYVVRLTDAHGNGVSWDGRQLGRDLGRRLDLARHDPDDRSERRSASTTPTRARSRAEFRDRDGVRARRAGRFQRHRCGRASRAPHDGVGQTIRPPWSTTRSSADDVVTRRRDNYGNVRRREQS